MQNQQSTDVIPLACNLPTAEFVARCHDLDHLFAQATGAEKLSNGYEFHFRGEDAWFRQLVEFIQAERRCCPFFQFELIVLPQQTALHLRLCYDDEAAEALVSRWVKLWNEH